jgi:hypothetical protein
MRDQLDQRLALGFARRIDRRFSDDAEHGRFGQKSGAALRKHRRKLVVMLPRGVNIGCAVGACARAIADRLGQRGVDGEKRLPLGVALDLVCNGWPERRLADQIEREMFGVDIGGHDAVDRDRLARVELHGLGASAVAGNPCTPARVRSSPPCARTTSATARETLCMPPLTMLQPTSWMAQANSHANSALSASSGASAACSAAHAKKFLISADSKVCSIHDLTLWN